MKTYIVDSFTTEAFKGNPAGVCLTEQDLPEKTMLSIAKELNLSETAFVKKLEKANHYSIRYFSPVMEIPLCGHATLASAKILFEKEPLEDIHFLTIENIDLYIQKSDGEIKMEFPIYDLESATIPPATLHALGIQKIENCVYNKETNIIVVEIKSTEKLKNLTPDFEALKKSHDSINGVLVTAKSENDEFDFHSRYFWPWSGTNEDPVTGGTHTFLTKYWGNKLNKTKMKSFQSSARTGSMELELINEKTFTIKSNAVIVFEGTLNLQL